MTDASLRHRLDAMLSLAKACAIAAALAFACVLFLATAATAAEKKDTTLGFDDTPFLPDGKWRVHDVKRPRPHAVTPGTASTRDKPGTPPSDAVVLFDGKDLSKWQVRGRGKDKGKILPAAWKVTGGYMEAVPKSGSIFTKETFGDCQIHLEWAAPLPAKGAGQERGNSGVLIMGRYEVQVLDSYESATYADGQAASIYGQWPPLANACRPPGEWQTYDIIFEAPRFEDGKLAKPAFATVIHNGVLMHHRKELLGPARHKQVTKYAPHEAEGPLQLQEHGNPIRYRNVWVRRLTGYDQPAGGGK